MPQSKLNSLFSCAPNPAPAAQQRLETKVINGLNDYDKMNNYDQATARTISRAISRTISKTIISVDSAANPRPLSDVERDHILNVLQICNWRISKSARKLAISRTTLYRKMKEFGLEVGKTV